MLAAPSSEKESHALIGLSPTNPAGRDVPIDFRKFAILLDVDGTLLDIALTPGEVEVPMHLRATLSRLQELTGGATALVSGRPVADLDRIFAPLHLPAIGGHGAEMRLRGDGGSAKKRASPLDQRLKQRVIDIANGGNDITVEDKGYSVALHYRKAPELGRTLPQLVAAVCAEFEPAAIEVLPGKAVIEIKAAGFNKGTALRELMTYPPFAGRRPIFIGDDITDEAAFAVLPEYDGLGISVGRLLRGTTIRFDSPGDVRRWLDKIAGDGAV
jgi:trehalose 6-phosphate phosphatase